MTSKNGHGPDIDLSAVVDDLSVKVTDDYKFAISLDIPLPLLARVSAVVTKAGEAFQGKSDGAGLDDEVYAVTEEVLRLATPGPPVPVPELFTRIKAVTFLGFFLNASVEPMTGAAISSGRRAASPTPSTGV